MTLNPKSGKESGGGKLRKTVSDRNAGLENDMRVRPIEVRDLFQDTILNYNYTSQQEFLFTRNQ